MNKHKNVFVYDIETYRNCISICFYNVDNKKIYYWINYNNKVLKKEHLENFGIDTSNFLLISDLSKFLKNVDWLIGYNNKSFDDHVLRYILLNKEQASCKQIRDYAMTLIKNDRQDIVYYYRIKLPKVCYDLMRLYGFHREGFRKSLKQIAINLNWHLIQELPIHPDELINIDDLNTLLKYNLNDVLITNRLFEESKDLIKLRHNINKIYKVDVLNQHKSGISKILLEKFYSEYSQSRIESFVNLRTERYVINIKDCISDKIKFQTDYFKNFLNDIKEKKVFNGQSLEEFLTLDGLTHTIKSGGIHSENNPAIYETNDEYELWDFDFDSFYPYLMLTLGIAPKHLDKNIFLTIIKTLIEERIKAKKLYKESLKTDIPDIENKIRQEVLKIVINSVYGLLDSNTSFLYDPLCRYKVCTNGQLYILMIIEDMYLNGIQCIMSNTDGTLLKVPKDKIELFKELCDKWYKYFNIGYEINKIEKVIFSSVNSYLLIKKHEEFDNSKETYKEYLKRQIKHENIKQKNEFVTEGEKIDLEKSSSNKAVAYILNAYYLNNVPIENTDFFKSQLNIYDYSLNQKVDKSFNCFYIYEENGNLIRTPIQNANRFYCSTHGGNIIKTKVRFDKKKQKDVLVNIKIIADSYLKIINNEENLKLDDYNINYKWYINAARKIINNINYEITKKGKTKSINLQNKLEF